MRDAPDMKRHGWLLWIVIPLLLGGLIWWLTEPPSNTASPDQGFAGNRGAGEIPTRSQLASLQAKADAACLCGRARSDPWNDGCWADYRQSVAPFNPTTTATTCAEESVALDCFGPEGHNQLCVSTGREYGACSDAEQASRVTEARRRRNGGCEG
jgi:hypothetical protein